MTKEILFFIALFFNYTTAECSYITEEQFNNSLISCFVTKENNKKRLSSKESLTSNQKINSHITHTTSNKISEEKFFELLLADYRQKLVTKKQENTTPKTRTDHQTIPVTPEINKKKQTLPDNDCWLFARLGSAHNFTNDRNTSSIKNGSFATNPTTTATPFDATPYQKNSSLTFEGYEK